MTDAPGAAPGVSEAPRLETPRLVLRGHTVDDFAATAALWADADVVRHTIGRPSTAEEAWGRMLRYAGLWRLVGYGYWVVEDRATGAYLGEAGLADFHRGIAAIPAGVPEAGWVLRPDVQGRGLATEAVDCVLTWADAGLAAPETACLIMPENAASLRVADKVGFGPAVETRHRDEPALVRRRPRGAGARPGRAGA
jgi:RimJ/RimL family protein N-acetyltransferase